MHVEGGPQTLFIDKVIFELGFEVEKERLAMC